MRCSPAIAPGIGPVFLPLGTRSAISVVVCSATFPSVGRLGVPCTEVVKCVDSECRLLSLKARGLGRVVRGGGRR